MRAEDVVGTLDEQTSEIRVAGLGDAELRVPITGLAASRSQAEVAADIATLLEALLAAQGQDECRSRNRTNTMNLQESLCLRIFCLAELLDLTVVLLDLERHLGILLEHGAECLSQTLSHHGQASLRKGACRRRWHALAARLRQPSYGVHCRRTQSNDEVPGADQRQGLLLFNCPVRNRPQDLRIKPGVAGQLLRINLIALTITMRDGSQFADVRHDTSWPSSCNCSLIQME